jgi:hypothetical protein
MLSQQEIVNIVRLKGPLLPVQISKDLNTDVLMASAILSKLVSEGMLKISHIKVGGSPLYYVDGQEYKLQNYADNLHEKEKHVFNLLREKKMLRDKDQDPIVRVALRQIRDFAKPLEVTIANTKEIFWKWYLLPNSEAEAIIKSQLKVAFQKKETKPKTERRDIQKKEESLKEKSEEQKKLEPKKTTIETPDPFLSTIMRYFEQNRIEEIEQKIIRKKSEIDFTVRLPSSVGSLTYYCKAKNKKRINDGDISSAFVQGQMKKLPVLLLITGDLTKKARDMLDKEFKNITIKKV